MRDNDSTLLRRYVDDRSETAFTIFVQRHIGLVYSCAMRRVGYDVQLAEDVTQEVFAAVARKALKLAKRPSLLGWLHVSTQLAAAATVRAERRRKVRETHATLMETILNASTPAPEIDWTRLRPLLDELIANLKDLDREALMLRFFEKRPFAEVAATLSLTEEGARKRVERATERIRLQLARRGVTSTSGAIALALGEQAGAAVPAALAGNVAATAFGQFAAAGGGGAVLAAVAGALASNTALVVATVVAASGVVAWQARANGELEAELARAKSPTAEIRALQESNRQSVRRIAEAADLERDQATIATTATQSPSVSLSESVATVNVHVTAKGTLLWENQPVTLNDYLARLSALQAQAGNQRPQVIVQGAPGSGFGATAYAVEQASKAGIADIAVVTTATPPPQDNWITPGIVLPGPGDKNPPSIPDRTVEPAK